MPPKISVIVVSFNTRELLRECLDAVDADDYAGEVETFVVDNASHDGSAAMVRERFPHARLIENADNVGFARANNQALADASGELLLLLNSDAVLRPGCMTALATALDAQPDAGVAGPALFNPDGSRQPSWGAFPTPVQEAVFQSYLFKALPIEFPLGRTVHPRMHDRYEHRRPVDWVTGAALIFRREVYSRIGGLPEHTFMYGEDLEFCALAREAGFGTLYEPAAEAMHHLGASSRKDHARWIGNYTEATLGYYARFEAPSRRRAAAAAVMAGSAYRQLLWGALGVVRPERREEVASRARGYRRAIGHALKALK